MIPNEPSPPLRRALSVLFVLPPDFDAPFAHKVFRFPPQGPAIVAASLAEAGVALRLCDLELSVYRAPLAADRAALDTPALMAHLAGRHDEALDALATELLGRIDDLTCDAVAFSLDRHTQIRVACLLAYEVKRRTGKPVLLGGANALPARKLLNEAGSRGVDLATYATTPHEIRAAFEALRELSPGRRELTVEPIGRLMPAKPEEWPAPDFSLYDLPLYRRDPFKQVPEHYRGYDGMVGPVLMLPYHFTYDCQYVCTFCQRGGTQSSKSMDQVVRDLAGLAERYETRDFMLFDAQINLYAEAFSKALLDARLSLRWSDSYRVRPSSPEALDRMAKAGCVSLTFGVESASDKMLRKMKKGHLAWHATRVLHEAHERQIMTRVNLLPCFPGETRQDLAETCDWLEENAGVIDDIAPSSFYLAEGSPIGQSPEEFGIRMRERRLLLGDHKFRKNLGSLAYDEIDGMTWEERSETLRPAEEALREAWERGRGPLGRVRFLQSVMAFGLRKTFPTKDQIYGAMLRWMGPPPPPPLAIAWPKDPSPALASRFDAVMRDALPSVTRYLGGDGVGHMLLFDDGDYLCFRGEVERAGETGDLTETLRIDSIVATRFRQTSPRVRVYGRLQPGASLRLTRDALTSHPESEAAPWRESLRCGTDVELLSFAPAA